jgi:hypothetical protein
MREDSLRPRPHWGAAASLAILQHTNRWEVPRGGATRLPKTPGFGTFLPIGGARIPLPLNTFET